MSKRVAIYAGTFDPMTIGHRDLVERSLICFDKVILAVGINPKKKTMFTVDERMALATASLEPCWNVEVTSFSGLLVNYAKERGVNVLVRGLRAFSDFEFELQMALTNRKLEPEVETLFLMPSEEYSYISSSRVKEVASLGGDISDFVTKPVHKAILAKL